MLNLRIAAGCLVLALGTSLAQAADYRAEILNEGPPTDSLSADIAKLLSSEGTRVIRGSDTTFCEVWLRKEIETKPDFEPTPGVSYPLIPGQFIGAVRFARRGADFRDQRIDRGVYTLRYAQQPVDGAHIGTSLTRDFLLLISAEEDQSPQPLGYDELTAQSSDAVGTSHPGLLSLQRVQPDAKSPSTRHDERHDWWIVRVEGKTAGGKSLPLELVVVGVGAE